MTDRPMAFTEHLGELRDRLLKSVVAVTIAFFVAYGFHEELFKILAAPILEGLRAHGIYKLQALQVTETIVVYLQASLVGSVILSVPYVFFQIWSFVAPGLHPRERGAVLPVAGLVSAFFLLGIAFCYFVFLPMVVDFLVDFTVGTGDIALLPTVENTFSLTTTFLLIFGLVFEMPLIMFFVSALGMVTSRTFLKFARHFIVIAFIVAAVFTPPDPLSQLLMAVPLCALYMVGVAFAWAGGALRRSGEHGLAKAVVTGVFLVFALAVALAGWLWNRPTYKPSARASVVAETTFAIRADPASRLGRAITGKRTTALDLDAKAWVLSTGPAGSAWVAMEPLTVCPGDDPAPWWQPSSLPSLCQVSGAANDTGRSSDTFAMLDDSERPVSGAVAGECLVALAPAGLPGGVSMQFHAEEGTTGLATITLRFTGEAAARTAVADWMKDLQERLAPGHGIPGLDESVLGSLLAWSDGDFEVLQGKDATEISITTLPARAARMLARLAFGATGACGSREK